MICAHCGKEVKEGNHLSVSEIDSNKYWYLKIPKSFSEVLPFGIEIVPYKIGYIEKINCFNM